MPLTMVETLVTAPLLIAATRRIVGYDVVPPVRVMRSPTTYPVPPDATAAAVAPLPLVRVSAVGATAAGGTRPIVADRRRARGSPYNLSPWGLFSAGWAIKTPPDSSGQERCPWRCRT